MEVLYEFLSPVGPLQAGPLAQKRDNVQNVGLNDQFILDGKCSVRRLGSDAPIAVFGGPDAFPKEPIELTVATQGSLDVVCLLEAGLHFILGEVEPPQHGGLEGRQTVPLKHLGGKPGEPCC